MSKQVKKPLKYRVKFMAKEFNQDAQVIIDFLRGHKIKVKHPWSVVGSEVYHMVKKIFGYQKSAELATEVKQQMKTNSPEIAQQPAKPAPESNDKLYAVYLEQADSAKSAEQNGSDKEKKNQLNQPQNNNEQSTKATDVDKCEVWDLIPSTSERNDVKNVDSGKKKKKSKKQNKPQSNN